MQIYNVGLDALADWATADFRWLLVTSGSFDADQATIADVLVGAPEVTVAGYARTPVVSPVRDVDMTYDQITYQCGDPNFGSLAAGEDVVAIVLVKVVTDDTDSLPIGWQDLPAGLATQTIDPFIINVAGGVAAYVNAVA